MRVNVASPEEIDGGVARRGEKKCLGVGEPRGVFDAEEPRVSFLHEIVVVGQGGKSFGKIRAQGWFVRLHVQGKPAGSFSGGHRVAVGVQRRNRVSFYWSMAEVCRAGFWAKPGGETFFNSDQVQSGMAASKGRRGAGGWGARLGSIAAHEAGSESPRRQPGVEPRRWWCNRGEMSIHVVREQRPEEGFPR